MATKKPQDHKKPRHPKTAKFVYKGDDVTIELPYIENISMGVMLDVQDKAGDQAEAMQLMMTAVIGDEWREELSKLSLGEFQELQERWNEESAISLGEA